MIRPNELRRDNRLFQKSKGLDVAIDNPNGLHLIRVFGIDWPIEWLLKFGFEYYFGEGSHLRKNIYVKLC